MSSASTPAPATSTYRRYRHQHAVGRLIPKPREALQAPDPTVAVDVWPKEQTMDGMPNATHLLACCKWVGSARNAYALNISPDAKALGASPRGANVDYYVVEPDEVNAILATALIVRPPLQQLPNKTVVGKSLRRRKDGSSDNSDACGIDCHPPKPCHGGEVRLVADEERRSAVDYGKHGLYQLAVESADAS